MSLYELKEYISLEVHARCDYDIYNNLIDSVHDLMGTESRMCDGCKYFSDEILIPDYAGDGLCYEERNLENPVFSDMSCKKFEKKQ